MRAKSIRSKTPLIRRSSQEVVAVRAADRDAQFVALLRRKCMRAAITGALTAAIEAIPGLGRVFGFVFGEILDAQFLSRIQRELVEDTFRLYGLELPGPLHNELVNRVQTLGTSASIASDALMRGLARRAASSIGGLVAKRLLPIASITSSALSNTSVTYAIGKRAQAVAKWRDRPIMGMPDVVRAFSGIDERRILNWSTEAVKTSLGIVSTALKRMLRWPGARKRHRDAED
ncbi:MAG: hypothetical protein ABI846_15660 [Rudaea sp.]